MDSAAGKCLVTILDDYKRMLESTRRNVDGARRELDEYAQVLGLEQKQILTIRAVFGGLMADYDLPETDLGRLMARIILVIGRENLLKMFEEGRWPDD